MAMQTETTMFWHRPSKDYCVLLTRQPEGLIPGTIKVLFLGKREPVTVWRSELREM